MEKRTFSILTPKVSEKVLKEFSLDELLDIEVVKPLIDNGVILSFVIEDREKFYLGMTVTLANFIHYEAVEVSLWKGVSVNKNAMLINYIVTKKDKEYLVNNIETTIKELIANDQT